MKINILLTFCLILLVGNLFAQEKKKIDHTIYDDWKSFGEISQSKSGSWISYEINPSVGDGILYIENAESGAKKEFFKGSSAAFSHNENFVVIKIDIGYDTTRALKLEKVNRKKWPLDTLQVYYLKGDSTVDIIGAKSFTLSKEGDWMAYMLDEDKTPDCPEPKGLFKKKKKNNCKKPGTTGKTMVVWNPITNESKEFHGVVSYEFDKSGSKMAIVKSFKGEADTISVNLVDLSNWNAITLLDGRTNISKLAFNEQGNSLAFLSSLDTNKNKNYSLHLWKLGEENSNKIVDSLSPNLPIGYSVSGNRTPHFSEDGKKLFFGIDKINLPEEKDTLLDSEKAKVDIWTWNDPFIQPGQLLNKSSEDKKSFLSVYHIASSKIVQLADSSLENVFPQNKGNANFAFGRSTLGYEMERTWEYPWKSDFYKVELESGKRIELKKGITSGADLSPSGNYFIWFSPKDSAWFSMNIATGEEFNLTKDIDALFSDDNNGVPYAPEDLGSSGWIEINDKEYVTLNDRYDIWAVDPSLLSDPICMTEGIGADKKIDFGIINFERDSAYLQLDQLLIYGTDEDSKDGSYWSLNNHNGKFKIEKLLESEHRLAFISKAKESDQIILRRMNFQEYGEIEITSTSFASPKTITSIGDQQKEYNWGTLETVSWTAFDDSTQLRGLLYKPENFDSTKSYPLMVYFYEKYMERKHVYYAPRATASIIYPTEYVSNGYIVFIPDVVYESGHPAKSAFNCIVSGTEYLYKKHDYIDSSRMALQGQSWGGYQTAQLVTMTGMYKAAMAGAPVSNMFSAYGGVRWGSGYARTFQYERGQSRIGYTIWERPDLYIENSPLFGIPNITTPLLIMHNDNDGAVPWYQGIEMYVGMRRLGKPVWMLNYNGDHHNLTQLANKKDLSIRMRQFFDYYLLDAPMPEWMLGVPATNKGIDYKLELIEE